MITGHSANHFAKVADGASIRHVASTQACSPSLIDPVLQFSKSVNAVSVGADDNGDAEVFRSRSVDIVEVQPAAVSVDFHHATVIGGRLKDL
jgi:hypothetical protein